MSARHRIPSPASTLPPAAALLTSPAFVLALVLLVANDHLLKPAFGNWATGKLSDVAGLFAWALFWCALLPRRRAAVFASTALAWLAWKSPLADVPLALWNATGAWPLARVVDYGDWLALAALVPAWRVVARAQGAGARDPVRVTVGAWRRARALAGAVVAIVAFSATSRPTPGTSFYDEPGGIVAASRREVHDGLATLGFALQATYPRRASATDDSTIASQIVEFRIGHTADRDPVLVTMELYRVARDTTRLTLRYAVTEGGRRPLPDAVRLLFEDTVLAPLRRRFGPDVVPPR